MDTFFAVLAKDLRTRFFRPAELVFFLVLPLVFTMVLAGAGAGGTGAGSTGTETRGAPPRAVLVQDTVQSPASRGMIALLALDPGLRIREVSDPSELLRDGQVDLLLSIEPAPAPTPSRPFAVRVRLSPWRGSAGTTARRVETLLKGGTPSRAAPAAASASSGAYSSAATGSAGQMVTWVLIPLLGLGAGFIAERRRGTLRRILASPARRSAFTAGAAGADVLAAFVQVALLVLFGTLFFHLPWLSHPLELAAISAAFCVAGGALGSLLGAFCSTERQAGSLGLAVALVMAVLGGCWYPASAFPAAMKAITHWNPAGWAMEGFMAVLTPGSDAMVAVKDAGLLAALGVAAFSLAALVSRIRGGRASAA